MAVQDIGIVSFLPSLQVKTPARKLNTLGNPKAADKALGYLSFRSHMFQIPNPTTKARPTRDSFDMMTAVTDGWIISPTVHRGSAFVSQALHFFFQYSIKFVCFAAQCKAVWLGAKRAY